MKKVLWQSTAFCGVLTYLPRETKKGTGYFFSTLKDSPPEK
jgi:hypothetical protein